MRAEQSMLYMLDPDRFVRAGGFEPDPWQSKFLRSGHKRKMLNCSRQSGKSTVVAWDAVHMAVYQWNSLILLLSPGERQSGELMRKVFECLGTAPDVPKTVADGTLYVEFVNGSRIVALPGKEGTVRGYSAVRKLVVDEASRVADELYFAVKPMLAVSGGYMQTLSSPYGTRGWWYEQKKGIDHDKAHGLKTQWDYYEVPATMIPRIPPEFLEAELRNMGEWWFRQEYMCEFMDAQAAAFGAKEVAAAFAEGVIPWRLGSSLVDKIGAYSYAR